MNKRIISSMLAAIALTMGFTACSNDNDDSTATTVVPEAATTLELDSTHINAGVGEAASMNILKGGGDYKIFSEDTTIAKALLEGNTIKITTLKKGITGLVLSDKAGNYKRIEVKSMYMKIATNKDTYELSMKLGHNSAKGTIIATAGNGNYTAVSDNTGIVKVEEVSGDNIILSALKEGSANITITDMMGLSKTVKVTVVVSKIPFTQEEKEAIMKLVNPITVWDDAKYYNNSSNYYGATSGHISFDYWNAMYMHFFFKGDLTAGKKTQGKVKFVKSWDAPEQNFDNVEIEILKNDGKHVWGIASKVDPDYIHTGYFYVPIVK